MSQIQLRFFTKQTRFHCKETTYSVLGSSTIKELNELIKQILIEEKGEDELLSSTTFDFLVEGEFLRVSLLEHINEKGLSVESVLPVEYVEQQSAPVSQQFFEHNDWVSGVRISTQHILTGAYDGSVTVWSQATGEQVASAVGHVEPVKSVAWIHDSAEEEKKLHFVTSSQDQHLIVWECDPGVGKLKPVICCKGHARSVDCCAVNDDKSLIASGSWDTTVKLWSASPHADHQDKQLADVSALSRKKRIKIEQRGLPRPAKMTMSGHGEAVTGVAWLSRDQVCSASWDHSLRVWNVDDGLERTHMKGTKAITSLDFSPLLGLIATGSSDRHVRLWDPRTHEGKVVKSALTSHHGWVTCVRWSRDQPNSLVSGSFDNLVKMWDIRSPKTPLYDLEAHTDKVMCVDWRGSQVASGGSDCKVFTYSTRDGAVERQLT